MLEYTSSNADAVGFRNTKIREPGKRICTIRSCTTGLSKNNAQYVRMDVVDEKDAEGRVTIWLTTKEQKRSFGANQFDAIRMNCGLAEGTLQTKCVTTNWGSEYHFTALEGRRCGFLFDIEESVAAVKDKDTGNRKIVNTKTPIVRSSFDPNTGKTAYETANSLPATQIVKTEGACRSYVAKNIEETRKRLMEKYGISDGFETPVEEPVKTAPAMQGDDDEDLPF